LLEYILMSFNVMFYFFDAGDITSMNSECKCGGKTKFKSVKYLNDDSLKYLVSNCPYHTVKEKTTCWLSFAYKYILSIIYVLQRFESVTYYDLHWQPI
jgi:hypothetical protein